MPISNIKPLKDLKELTLLDLDYNNIADRSVLSEFASSTKISLYGQKSGDTFLALNGKSLGQDELILTEWPQCLKKLKPFSVDTGKLPDYFLKIYEEQDIEKEDINIPVNNIVPLGNCPVSRYLECPNFPEHHYYSEARSLDSGIGRYYWFDFDLVSGDKSTIPLRMVYCYGDGDTNDGMWGAFWNRKTREKVADIKSTGDMETTICVISKNLKESYTNHDIWVPTVINYYEEPDRYDDQPDFVYQHDTELEKILGVAIRLCEPFRSKDTIKMNQINRKPTDHKPGYVFFEDIQLEKYIHKLLNKTGPILIDDVKTIESLTINNQLIIKLGGLEHFASLVTLDLSDNRIWDITPLAGLTKLKKLNLGDNGVGIDITPLL